ncbi:hypothetical protein SESBI_37593 [Sesbania bispinosa]|nr:hypothetical protein SESBI_37593 [Sesbania bispinosa]
MASLTVTALVFLLDCSQFLASSFVFVSVPGVEAELLQRYNPGVDFSQGSGLVFILEKDMFHYSLCPRDRFSMNNVNEYHREWAYRTGQSNNLIAEMRKRYMKRPKRPSLQVVQNRNEALELAINMIRHENNHMQIRINRYDAIAEVCHKQSGHSPSIEDDMVLENVVHKLEYCTDGDLLNEEQA